MTDFIPFPKVARLFRNVVITEKIDGTNACVHVADDFTTVTAASRSRWITPQDDNHGFAKWVAAHAEELRELGPGFHFGEWWGSGIQRGYGLKEKRFSLFNSHRWTEKRPACCGVVPVLAQHTMSTGVILDALESLRVNGSVAAPGFMKPEGIVIYHTASDQLFKVTLDNDTLPKSVSGR